MTGVVRNAHLLLLVGSFAGTFYAFGLLVGVLLPNVTVPAALAGLAAFVILLVTAFVLDPDAPLLDAGE